MSKHSWDAQQYRANAAFVAELGSPVLGLLNPQAHEHILDLGCGDGALTAKIEGVAKSVRGIDFSQSMVDAAKARGLKAYFMSGDAL